jgi:hypothetical protein
MAQPKGWQQLMKICAGSKENPHRQIVYLGEPCPLCVEGSVVKTVEQTLKQAQRESGARYASAKKERR